ncbi:MAG: molecular chaperone DnaK [Nitrososphaerota archaeon]|nr:molecular chaperone DnaK [Nitrososphaerota archaeon]MDG6930422.1 molecular chaperone DnaK [Nitrososphaerota archaeon]
MASSQGQKEKIIGIDLGTTNSAAAVMEGGRPVIIPSAEGPTIAGKMFPSVVAFTKDNQLLVGESAKRQAVTNPEGTIFEAKRKMGLDFKFRIYGKEFSPQQISSFILQKIKKDAETYLGYPVKKAVITVPAHFNDNQRQATKDAAEIAGLEVVRIINEPTAACLAFGVDKQESEMKILVFSFGGGTHDATLMEFGGGVFQVLATSGDNETGGSDIDRALVNYLLEEFKKDAGIDLRSDTMAMMRLKEAAEKAKIELSNLLTTDIDLPFIATVNGQPKHLHYTLTRAKLEELSMPIIEKIRPTIQRVLADAKLTPENINKVILIGGMTRMPLVRKFVEDTMGKPAERGVDPMEAVAIGAAIQGAVLAGEIKNIVLLDVTPVSLGVETLGGIFTKLIEKNTTIPTKRSEIFTTAADFQTTVTIHVLQGERAMAADNVSLGMFNLDGIPPAPRGVPKIEVTFDIDANGILHVSAKDTATGKEAKITITSRMRLSEEEKQKMVKEAEEYAEQDKKKLELATLRNESDTLLYTSKKMRADMKDKISESDAKSLEQAENELSEALKGNDSEVIKQKIESIKSLMEKIGSSMYQSSAQQAAGQQAAGQQANEQQQQPGESKKTYDVSGEKVS